jgi:hypothetical protein
MGVDGGHPDPIEVHKAQLELVVHEHVSVLQVPVRDVRRPEPIQHIEPAVSQLPQCCRGVEQLFDGQVERQAGDPRHRHRGEVGPVHRDGLGKPLGRDHVIDRRGVEVGLQGAVAEGTFGLAAREAAQCDRSLGPRQLEHDRGLTGGGHRHAERVQHQGRGLERR